MAIALLLTVVGPGEALELSQPASRPLAAASVLTQHNDNLRTGAYLTETQLTPTTLRAGSFGRVASRAVDGPIGAQPLYVHGVSIDGAPRNVLYIATRNNSVYAFDADNIQPDAHVAVLQRDSCGDELGSSGALLWRTCPFVDSHQQGAADLPGMDDGPADYDRPCRQTHGPVGILSTPVIDLDTNSMYVVHRVGLQPDPKFRAFTRLADLGTFRPEEYVVDAHYWLQVLDISTGTSKLGPLEITYQSFEATMQLNRPGLLLDHGVLYVAFGSAVCDSGGNPWLPASQNPLWHGWIFAYRAHDLQLVDVFNTTPRTSGAGIWASGNGLAADRSGNVYALTGNNFDSGRQDANHQPTTGADWIAAHDCVPAGLSCTHVYPDATELGESFLKLQLRDGKFVRPAEHFTAGNWYTLDTGIRAPHDPAGTEGDTDLGSGGPLVLPNGWLLGGGKEGRLYVIDPTDMLHARQGFQAFYNSWLPQMSPCDYDKAQSWAPNIHGNPIFWKPDDSPNALLYGMPEKEYLKAFRVSADGHIDEQPLLTTVEAGQRSPWGMPGAMLSLSANGGRDGIVWASVPEADALNAPGTVAGDLIAFDATTLTEVWRDNLDGPIGANPQSVGPLAGPTRFMKFVPPTVADGKVFRVSYDDRVIVYALGATSGGGGVAASLARTRPVTAAWRNAAHLDLFMASRDSRNGDVLSTNFEGTCPANPNPTTQRQDWREWFPVMQPPLHAADGPASGAVPLALPAGAPVTAAARDVRYAPHLDLFAAQNGQVQSAVWDDKGGWQKQGTSWSDPGGWKQWFPIGPANGTAVAGEPVTALWSAIEPEHLDVFITDIAGHVVSAFHTPAGWTDWFAIQAGTGAAIPGQAVTAIWSPVEAGHLDLFMTDIAGHIVSTYHTPNTDWRAWFPIGAETTATGQPVTALWSPIESGRLDLFITDSTGHVASASHTPTGGWSAWFPISPTSGTAVPGQPVTAVWSPVEADHLDLFMSDGAGHVVSAYHTPDGGWSDWFPIGTDTPTVMPGQLVTAIWSQAQADHLDVFVTDHDGRVVSTYHDSSAGWHAWFAIP